MNEDIASILEQARQFVLQHAPADLLREAVPFGIICLVAGIGLSVLGAKLSRYGFVCAFAVLGGYLGAFFARQTGFSAPVCAGIGALMIGVIAHQTFRLWVGVAAALVLSSATLGVFGYQQVLPYVGEFEQTVSQVPVEAGESFALPSPEQQQAYRDYSPRQWLQGLWAFVAQKDAQVERNGRALALGAMVTGLCLGVLAMRWALILSTSLVGTGFVTTAMATLLTHSAPQSYEAFQQHPVAIGIGVGAFLVTSLIIQTMLTRKAPSAKKEPQAKS